MTQAHITNPPNVSDVTVNFGFLETPHGIVGVCSHLAALGTLRAPIPLADFYVERHLNLLMSRSQKCSVDEWRPRRKTASVERGRVNRSLVKRLWAHRGVGKSCLMQGAARRPKTLGEKFYGPRGGRLPGLLNSFLSALVAAAGGVIDISVGG
jgi:hypothetical protein